MTRAALATLTRLIGTRGNLTWPQAHAIRAQIQVGLAVRREIRLRATGRRPPRTDLTQPIVDDLLPALGSDRALDAVTAVLTAVAGPPGAAAGCLMFALASRPDWADRLAGELAGFTLHGLCQSGVQSVPVTHRFVREVLRMWTPPLLMTRSVRTPVNLPTTALAVGQQYLVSPFMVHHDPRHWRDPDTFDPDRWLPTAMHGPPGGQHTVPFGWPPTACIGAGLGTLQLVLLCHLLSTRYRIHPADPAAMRIALAAVPVPLDFHGTLALR